MSQYPHGQFLLNGLQTDPPLPADAPTIGSKLNHLCIRVRDLKKTLHFYVDLMGMRTVFVLNSGPMTVYFLGFPSNDRHREDLQAFGKETSLPNTMGLLELFYVHGSEKHREGFYSNGNTPPHLGFCHLGFSVPDLHGTLQKLKADGVEVVKDVGECDLKSLPITEWENEQGNGIEIPGSESEIHPAFKHAFSQFAYVKDPDGYWVELLPQTMS